MKRPVVLLFVLILIPLHTNDGKPVDTSARWMPVREAAPVRHTLQALADYNNALAAHGERTEDQGVLIESEDGRVTFAAENEDRTFNPASVMKLATSLVALSKLGPAYRFKTNFLADGILDSSGRKLEGDLVVGGGHDPMFSAADAGQVAKELARAGVSHVTGALRIAGPFTYFANGYHDALSPATSASKLLSSLERSGIRIEGGTSFGPSAGRLLVTHYSDQLSRILLFQNAHSSNPVAEVIGQSVGGPEAIQNYLVHDIGLRDADILVGRASGLDLNRITPRAALTVLRALVDVLGRYSLELPDVMAVAGVDTGTLRGRFVGGQTRGSIVAKTGTLISIDGGVSTLVGVAHTRQGGTLLFAVFDSDGNVHGYRHLQDNFIQAVVSEEGGGVPKYRLEDGVADFVANSIVQDFWQPGIQEQARDSAAD